MEIIIQGKPISGSKISTSGIESSLVDRIYKDFFEKMGGIRTSQALIVDTIYWQNSWYSIYTYSRYSGIIDTADRQSYFALSIVVPKNFLYLTSGVYYLLQKAYQEKIEGVYISKVGKYLVSDFSDIKAFNAIVEYIGKEFANSNLEDPIDNEFKKTHTANIPVYNLSDCDSIAFLQDLKENGRVIVGEGAEFPPKCAASIIQSKDQQIDILNAKLSEQNKDMDKLKRDLEEAQRVAQNSANNSSATIKKLNAEIEQLKREKDQAKQQLAAKQKEFDELVQRIQALMPSSPKKPINEERQDIDKEKSLFRKILDYIPFVNCVLLIAVCLCFLFVRPFYTNLNDSENANLIAEINRLKEDSKKKDERIQEQAKTIQSFKDASQEKSQPKGSKEIVSQSTTQDVDCEVLITKLDNTTIRSNDTVQDRETITISWNPQHGYKWHADNLDDDIVRTLNDANNDPQIGVTVTIKRKDVKKNILLWYRADDPANGDKNHRNNKNRFIFK